MSTIPDTRLDTSGLTCPLPVLKAKKALKAMAPGQLLEVVATDPQSPEDFAVLCETQGHKLLSSAPDGQAFRFLIERA
jgi:tRNA 2-thiouridine synthesizing protein A